jgi:hypothetical protein
LKPPPSPAILRYNLVIYENFLIKFNTENEHFAKLCFIFSTILIVEVASLKIIE